ncbi:MAG: reverse transcriptase N-terminal domain-containing protein [Janthinobacterium lividum]
MTSVINLHLGASSASTQLWDAINWPLVRCDVKRLQMRIAKAVRDKRYGKVKALHLISFMNRS